MVEAEAEAEAEDVVVAEVREQNQGHLQLEEVDAGLGKACVDDCGLIDLYMNKIVSVRYTDLYVMHIEFCHLKRVSNAQLDADRSYFLFHFLSTKENVHR